jgi:hypothetical protein
LIIGLVVALIGLAIWRCNKKKKDYSKFEESKDVKSSE